ncbi:MULTISPECIES: flippase [Haloarcula]|uniref:flippase n=1 Tax=Haloarcula TaxID=2237 RepID=UPI000F8E4A67|nr:MULTISPECIES: flippase [Haloarcula]NHX38168.1 flippase [Haloarcula sp. R1-2]
MTSDSTAVGKAGILVLLGTALGMLSSFIFRITLSNNISKSAFGTVILFLSLINIIAIPTVFGLREGIVKYLSNSDLASKERDSIITFSLVIVTTSSLIVALIGIVFADNISVWLFDNTDTTIVYILLASLPIYGLNKLFKGILRGFMSSKNFIKHSKIVEPLSLLTIAIPLSYLSSKTDWIVLGVFFSYVITLMYGIFITIRSGWSPGLNIDFNYGLLSFSFPLMISSSVFILLSQFDKVAIGYYMSSEFIGIYEVAVTIAMLLGLFRTGFGFLLYPKITELISIGNEKKISKIYNNSTKWILALTTPAFVAICIRPHFLIRAFGEHYSVGTIRELLIILGFGLFINAVVGPNGEALLGFGKSKTIMVYNIISVVINLFLNVILIPIYGLQGAAFASMVGYLSMNILKSGDLLLNHEIKILSIKSIIMGLSGAVITIYISNFVPVYNELYFNISSAVLLYIVCFITEIVILWAQGGITSDDVELINSTVSDIINAVGVFKFI